MARVDIAIVDCDEGHAHFQFRFDPELPVNFSDWTPAQIEAVRLIELMNPDALPMAPVDPLKLN